MIGIGTTPHVGRVLEILHQTVKNVFIRYYLLHNKNRQTVSIVNSNLLNLFQHTGSEGLTTLGTHTTPIARYIDDLTFKFEPRNDGSCLVDVSTLKINKIVAYAKSNIFHLRPIVFLKLCPSWTLAQTTATCSILWMALD